MGVCFGCTRDSTKCCSLFPQLTERPKEEKTPLEEVKNILAPLAQLTTSGPRSMPCSNTVSLTCPMQHAFEMPANHLAPPAFPIASDMKGVILTVTGKPVATQTLLKLMDLPIDLSRVGHSLGFAKVFNFNKADGDEDHQHKDAGAAMLTLMRLPSRIHGGPRCSRVKHFVLAM